VTLADVPPGETRPDPSAAGPRCLADAVCPADLEPLAARVLPPHVWDFVRGGGGRETALAANRSALDRVRVVPRVLCDVSACTTATRLLGRDAAMPLAVAPMAYQRLVHPDGELAAARAARDAGVPLAVPMLSSVPLERITGTGATTWFQLYWLREREQTLALVRRAEDAGCAALVLTVDVPWMGRRRRDLRNGFSIPDQIAAVHLPPAARSAAHRSEAGTSAVARHTAQVISPALAFAHLEDLRARTTLPLVVKGVLDPDDAARAADCGADAMVVSNHGGRQFDGAVGAADALPAVVRAVGERCTVLLDGGVRDGTDIVKALALGAAGVLLGRPLLWGLAAGGEEGARRVLALLADELHDALGLAGCATPAAAHRLRTTAPDPAPPRPGTA
jgi:4-hydroxymandelate oxidase